MLKKHQILIYIFGFILILVAADRLTFSALKLALQSSDYRYIKFYNTPESKPVDIIFIGNSRAEQSFPRHSFDSFSILNFGKGWAGLALHKAMFEDYIEIHKAPQILFIETEFLSYSGSGLKQGATQSIFSERVEKAISTDLSRSTSIARQLFATYRLNDPNFIPSLVYVVKKDNKNIAASNRTITQEQLERTAVNIKEAKLISHNKESLKQLVNTAKAAGTDVYLVSTPILYKMETDYQLHDKYMQAIDILATENAIQHLNYSRWSSELSHFADYKHLNRYGLELFSESLVSCISKSDNCLYFGQ